MLKRFLLTLLAALALLLPATVMGTASVATANANQGMWEFHEAPTLNLTQTQFTQSVSCFITVTVPGSPNPNVTYPTHHCLLPGGVGDPTGWEDTTVCVLTEPESGAREGICVWVPTPPILP